MRLIQGSSHTTCLCHCCPVCRSAADSPNPLVHGLSGDARPDALASSLIGPLGALYPHLFGGLNAGEGSMWWLRGCCAEAAWHSAPHAYTVAVPHFVVAAPLHCLRAAAESGSGSRERLCMAAACCAA